MDSRARFAPFPVNCGERRAPRSEFTAKIARECRARLIQTGELEFVVVLTDIVVSRLVPRRLGGVPGARQGLRAQYGRAPRPARTARAQVHTTRHIKTYIILVTKFLPSTESKYCFNKSRIYIKTQLYALQDNDVIRIASQSPLGSLERNQ